jgi:hypothetical protein
VEPYRKILVRATNWVGDAVMPLPALRALRERFPPSTLGRKKRNFRAIFALNLLLGWAGAGWIASLIWALTVDTPVR